MPRIIFVHQNLLAEGAEAAEARQMISALASTGAQVCAIYRAQAGQKIEFESRQVLDMSSLSVDQKSIQRALHHFNADVAHIKSCWTPGHCRAASALRAGRIPYVVEPGGHLFDVLLANRYGGKKSSWFNRLAKRVYRRICDLPMIRGSAAIRALSPYESSIVEEKTRVACYTIPLGFNSEWLNAMPHRQLYKMDQPMHFLFLGRLDVFQKGLDLIVEAAALLNDQGKEARYRVTIAGPSLGDSRSLLTKLIRERGLRNVSLSGPACGHEKQRLLADSDVFLHPSRFEEMAKLAREATASGLPVIATLQSNYGDWAVQYGFGLSTKLAAHSLALQMQSIIDNPQRLTQMSEASLRYASSHSWSSIAAKMLTMYDDALRN